MPKVSVCIPAYNQVKYLKRTIDSVLAQTYTDYEIIVSDDSPSTIVADLIADYNQPAKIKYFKNRITLGSPENWNESIRKANGEYIKILHHDDWFTDEFSLNAFVNMLEESPESDFAFSAAVAISVKDNRTWIHSATVEQLLSLRKDPSILFFGNFIGPPSSIIHRKNDSICYDINLKWVVDFDFYIKQIRNNGNKFSFSKKPLITSVSGDFHNVTNECENNKEVVIFEYMYLFNKLRKLNRNLNNSERHLIFLKEMFRKFNIKSLKDIRDTGYNGALPMQLYLYLLAKKIKNVVNKA